MSLSVDILASYLHETHDSRGVVDFLRVQFPKSINTYLTGVKSQWMTIGSVHEDYDASYTAALHKAEALQKTAKGTNKTILTKAVKQLKLYNSLNLAEKNRVQRRLKVSSYSGHADVDALIQNLPLLPEYMHDLKITQEERSVQQRKSQQSLESKSSNVWNIKASDILRKAEAILVDPKAEPFPLACALSLVTGRRMVEIFKTGVFTPVPTLGDYAVSFSGQVKRDPSNSDSYNIPVLLSSATILAALSRLRTLKPCKNLTNSQINLKWSNSANAAAKAFLDSTNRTFHSLRTAYAVIAYHAALPHRWSLNLFVSRILGHSSLVNSLNYTCIRVENLEPKHKHPWPEAV